MTTTSLASVFILAIGTLVAYILWRAGWPVDEFLNEKI